MDRNNIDRVAHLAWKFKDFKAHDDILLHCGKKLLIFPRSITTSKVMWDRLKQLYQTQTKPLK